MLDEIGERGGARPLFMGARDGLEITAPRRGRVGHDGFGGEEVRHSYDARNTSLTGGPGWSAAGKALARSAGAAGRVTGPGFQASAAARGLQLGWAKPGENGP